MNNISHVDIGEKTLYQDRLVCLNSAGKKGFSSYRYICLPYIVFVVDSFPESLENHEMSYRWEVKQLF